MGELVGQPGARSSASSTSGSRRRPSRSPGRWRRSRVGGRRVPGLRRAPEILDWSEAGELFAYERPVDREAATLGGLHPAEMAAAIRRLPLSRRRVLAAALEDERLADLLEELSEDEQVRLVEELDHGASRATCSTRWRPTTPPTCSAEFSASRQAELLGEMDPDEAEPGAPAARPTSRTRPAG